MSWTMEQMGLMPRHLSTEIRTPREFVLISNIEDTVGELMTYVQRRSSLVDRILTSKMFRKDAAAALGVTSELTDSDLRILLTYLARDKQVLTYDGNVIKIAAPDESPDSVSKEDRAIASLKSLMSEINEQISLLKIRIVALGEQSLKAIESKNRSLALTALRSKKAAETVLAMRTNTLFQLEDVYQNIEQASDQVTMIRVMRGSAEVLRSLNAKVGSTQDVEDTLDSLRHEMGQVEDVGTAISHPGQDNGDVDEDKVDEELDALMCESRKAEEEKATEQTMRRLASVQVPSCSDHITPDVIEDPQQTTTTETQVFSRGYDIGDLDHKSLDSPLDGERDCRNRQRNKTWERS
ncbi:MAG: hypothetical protein LQ345_004623 [Seirophora villosa]|nr:MAG: hypothetical protein LQ345_004623 [Seirophora villosa]